MRPLFYREAHQGSVQEGRPLPSTPVVARCIPTQDASPPRQPSQVLSPLSIPMLKSIPEMLSPKRCCYNYLFSKHH